MKYYIAIFILLFFTGCSSAIMVDDTLQETLYEKAILEGETYIISSSFNAIVNTPVYLLGCTNNSETYFEVFDLSLEGTPFNVYFYENPTISNNGTLINGYNLDRNSLNTHDLKVYASPTVTNNGTLLWNVADYGTKKINGYTSIATKMILKENTCYLFSIVNNDGTNADVTSNFIWLENINNYR